MASASGADPAPDSMWRRGARLIVRSLRAHPIPHAIAMAGAALFVVASIGGAWVLKAVTDDVVIPAFDDGTVDRGDLFVALALVVAVSAVRGLSVVQRRWFLSMAELATQRDRRRDLLHHYLDVPLGFHRSRPAGELPAHADLDLTSATMVLKPRLWRVCRRAAPRSRSRTGFPQPKPPTWCSSSMRAAWCNRAITASWWLSLGATGLCTSPGSATHGWRRRWLPGSLGSVLAVIDQRPERSLR